MFTEEAKWSIANDLHQMQILEEQFMNCDRFQQVRVLVFLNNTCAFSIYYNFKDYTIINLLHI